MARVKKPAEVDPFGELKRPETEQPWASHPHATNDFGEVLHCSVCRTEQRALPGGHVCQVGHGGAVGYPLGSPELAGPGEMTPDQRHACGVGLSAAAGTRRQAGEKSTLPPPPEKPRTPLDDFLDETTRAVPLPRVDDRMERIAEHAFSIDVDREYRRLVDRLALGEARAADRGTRRQFLDEVERDTLMAVRIHQVAVAHAARWEIDARERAAVFRAEAVKQLSLEKETAARKKQITNDDVEDYCVGNYGDEWRHVAAMSSRLKGSVAVLAELVACYQSRQATLRDLCRGDGGGA